MTDANGPSEHCLILFYAAGASSLAPHILLREAGLPFTLERVDLGAKRWRNGDYREITPKAYVPALRLEDGDILTECAVILSYIADQAPGQGLMPLAGSRARYHACAWLNFLATEVHGNFITPERHGGVAANFLANTEEGQAATRALVAPRLEYIDRMLDGRRFLTGESLAAPDAYLFVMLTWALRIRLDLAPWVRFADYFTRIAARPAVIAAREIEGPPHALRS
ncbi:MAG: glutathione S-transferase N-terminal domain-containing protein [Gammaproteobacteria bacterium]|nr:glutathione S-transferase N-terminal domain-containing protein [Gammaproteobacteria bacterium]